MKMLNYIYLQEVTLAENFKRKVVGSTVCKRSTCVFYKMQISNTGERRICSLSILFSVTGSVDQVVTGVKIRLCCNRRFSTIGVEEKYGIC